MIFLLISHSIKKEKAMITHCDICGEKLIIIKNLNFKYIIGMADDYTQHIAMCPHCKLIVTANPFSEEQLSNRYKNFSKFEFDAETYIFDVSEEYKKRCLRQKHFIEENIPDLASIFEVGASSGYNLSLYTKFSKVLGIEPSHINCEGAKKHYDVDMFCGVFDEYYHQHKNDTDRKKYDMIFLSHTLEHIVNPCSFLKKCIQIASPKYFFIEVPTFDIKFINEPYGMFCEEHVNYFTLESLENLMNNLGFEIVDAEIHIDAHSRLVAGAPAVVSLWKKSNIQNTTERHYLNSVAKILKTYDQTSRKELDRISTIINTIHSRKLAVWGTGHHVSMLLANTSLLKKHIVKFYDSDSKKHAFQIAGIPIQAFDPQDIENGTIDTILLASYVAQNQMLKLLEPYKDKCRIVTLYDC